MGTIKQVVGHGAGDDGEARDELAQPPLPTPRPPALLRRCSLPVVYEDAYDAMAYWCSVQQLLQRRLEMRDEQNVS